jgi:ligand-binding SRPBCC domain-containing protein
MFVDVMSVGPYKYFRYEHYFERIGNKTIYRDVLYFSIGIKGSLDKLLAAPITTIIFRKRHQLLVQNFE